MVEKVLGKKTFDSLKSRLNHYFRLMWFDIIYYIVEVYIFNNYSPRAKWIVGLFPTEVNNCFSDETTVTGDENNQVWDFNLGILPNILANQSKIHSKPIKLHHLRSFTRICYIIRYRAPGLPPELPSVLEYLRSRPKAVCASGWYYEWTTASLVGLLHYWLFRACVI